MPAINLYPAEARILAQAYASAAHTLEEYGFVAVSHDADEQASYEAALAQARAFAQQRRGQLLGEGAEMALVQPVALPAFGWAALVRELKGEGEMFSATNQLFHDSIGQWGLELLLAYAAMREAEFRA